MKKKPITKLHLDAITIRPLDLAKLEQVRGGEFVKQNTSKSCPGG